MMENFGEGKKEKAEGWRGWVSYPKYVPERTVEMLDMIYDLLGENETGIEDRFSKMTDLLERAEKRGLIKKNERSRMESDLGPEM